MWASHADGLSELTPGMFDVNDGGTYSPAVAVTGSFEVTSSNNKGILALTYQIPASTQVTATYSFYFVSSNDIFLMAIDATTAILPRLAGEMILQQPGTPFDASALHGTSVMTASGLDGANASVLAGLLTGVTTPGGINEANSTYDQNDGGTYSPGIAAAGTYTPDPSGNGRMAFTGLGARIAAAYLTAPNQGLLIGSDAAVSYGLLDAQTSTAPFTTVSIQGGYTLSAETTIDPAAVNIVGQMDSLDGNGSMTGILDEADERWNAAHGSVGGDPNYVVESTGRGRWRLVPRWFAVGDGVLHCVAGKFPRDLDPCEPWECPSSGSLLQPLVCLRADGQENAPRWRGGTLIPRPSFFPQASGRRN